MGIIPLLLPPQFTPGKLALVSGDTLEIETDAASLSTGAPVPVFVHRAASGGGMIDSQGFVATAAIETALEVSLLAEGGILPYILRRSLSAPQSGSN
jgi:aconitate hydratase